LTRRLPLTSVGIASILAWGEPSAADEPIRIRYVAPAGCPQEAAFVTQVRLRTERWHLAAEGEAVRDFSVDVQRGPEGVAARLSIRAPAGDETTVRQLQGTSCDEVVDGIALMAALAIDPNASTFPTARTFPTAGTPLPLPAPAPVPIPARPLAPRPGWRISIGMDADLMFLDSALALGPSAFAEAGLERTGLLQPALRASFTRAHSNRLNTADGAAYFEWTMVGLDACPLRFRLGRSLLLGPCIDGRAGVLTATGSEVVNARSVSESWVDLRLVGRAQAVLFDTLVLEAAGGAIVPLLRWSYHFDPTFPAYRVPPAGEVVTVGVGVRFR
jgi:hypothetical protein